MGEAACLKASARPKGNEMEQWKGGAECSAEFELRDEKEVKLNQLYRIYSLRQISLTAIRASSRPVETSTMPGRMIINAPINPIAVAVQRRP